MSNELKERLSQLKEDIFMSYWSIDSILWRIRKFFRYIKKIIRREKSCRKVIKRANELGYKVIKNREKGQINLFLIDTT